MSATATVTVTVTMPDEHGNVRVLQLGREVQAAADLARQQLDRKYCRSAEQRAMSSRPSMPARDVRVLTGRIGVGLAERVGLGNLG